MSTLLLHVTTLSGSHVEVRREEDLTFSVRRVSDAPVVSMDGQRRRLLPREHHTGNLSVVIVHNGRVVAYDGTREVYVSSEIVSGVDHTDSATYAQFEPSLRCDALGTVIAPPVVVYGPDIDHDRPQHRIVRALVGAFGA